MLPPELLRGANAESGVHAYYGVSGGKNTYVGITNDLARRQRQHGVERFALDPITSAPVTRGQARAIEEAVINRAGGTAREGGGFQNLNHSISPSHSWYDRAVSWGESWLRGQGL